MKMFDFCVRQRENAFDAIFARVWVGQGTPPPETGLWWCRADRPSSKLSDWSQPIQIMTAEDRGWHSGPWKPSFEFDGQMGERAWVFFDGLYRTGDPGPFPFAFTLGCIEMCLPLGSLSHYLQGRDRRLLVFVAQLEVNQLSDTATAGLDEIVSTSATLLLSSQQRVSRSCEEFDSPRDLVGGQAKPSPHQ